MTKYLIGFLCLIILVISSVLILQPNSVLWFLASKTPLYVIGRLTVTALILIYALFPKIRFTSFKFLFGLMGIVLLYLGIAGLLPSGSIGINNYYPQLLDVFISLEAGIICLICALEMPAVEKSALTWAMFGLLNNLSIWLSKPRNQSKQVKAAH